MTIQSNHQIIIDLGYPVTRELLQKTVKALNSTFQFISSIKNKDDEYYIGISAINKTFSRIHPFQYFDGNYNNLVNALQQIDFMVRSISQINEEEYNDLLHVAIKTSLDDFSSFFKRVIYRKDHLEESFRPEKQLYITFITSKGSYKFKTKLQGVNSLLPGNCIKSIWVLKTPPHETSNIDRHGDEDGECNENYHQIDCKTTVIEEFKIRHEQLEDYLFKYYYESNRYIGRLKLILPEIVLYCEMSWFMINLQERNKANNNYNPFLSSNNESNEYTMEIIHKITNDCICESHIYGFPIEVTPANHLKFDYNRFIANRQVFMAISMSLTKTDSDEYLILKYKQQIESHTTNYFFMLRPGCNNMLMKSLIPWEMLSPEIDTNIGWCSNVTPDEQIKQTVDNSLAQIDLLNRYSPKKFKANFLNNITQFSPQPTKATKRKLLPTFSNGPETSKGKGKLAVDLSGKKRNHNIIHPALMTKLKKISDGSNTGGKKTNQALQDHHIWFRSFNDLNNIREQDDKNNNNAETRIAEVNNERDN